MSFLNRLNDRERLVVLGGGAVVLALVILQFVIGPLLDWRSDRARAAKDAERTYDLVVEAAARGAPAETAGDASRPVRNVISETAQAVGVELTYVNVRADGQVDASVSGADPQALFAWIATLERDESVRVVSADISREQGAGARVRAQLSFARGAG